MCERLIQHEVKSSAVFGSRPCQTTILHECGQELECCKVCDTSELLTRQCIKCFLVVFVWNVHFVDSNCIGFLPSDNKCLYDTSVFIKQTNTILLATSSDLLYACDEQCYIFLSVLYGNNSTIIHLIFVYVPPASNCIHYSKI